nr:hypothetical protein [Actinoplanes polyasparticus]
MSETNERPEEADASFPVGHMVVTGDMEIIRNGQVVVDEPQATDEENAR